MVLNKFFLNVHLRVTFIVLSSVLLGIVLQHLEMGYYYTLAGSVFLIVLQTWGLVNQVNRTNYDLEKFFASVHDHDSSVRFPKETGNSPLSMLHDRMNHVNEIIQNVKIENERTSHFLLGMVNHVDIGLISFDDSGKIEIYNRAALRYVKVQQPLHLKTIEMKNDEIFKIINNINPRHEMLCKIKIDNILQSILIKASEFKSGNKTIKLVSFQDITNELDKKEMDSWQKLIRVLTHEIMNSISPITSLTAVISGYFKRKDDNNPISPEQVDKQIIAKTLSGLDTIEETGKGLLGFVDKYRSLASLPCPDYSKFTIESLFKRCKLLMESVIPKNIRIVTSVSPEDITLVADYSQIEQVLLNLIKNSIAAIPTRENGIIKLEAFYCKEGTMIQVEDNGIGIPNDIIEEIFVPFYTTKEYGSGIGLSLSKQIMQNHNGKISVNSTPNNGAKFTLIFQL